MRKTKLPSNMKGGTKCNSCGALLVHSYNRDKELYQWKCQGCGATRYEPSARFVVQFQGADQL